MDEAVIEDLLKKAKEQAYAQGWSGRVSYGIGVGIGWVLRFLYQVVKILW